MDDIISVKNMKKVFKDGNAPPLVALRDINLEIRAGEFFVFVGTSGSGKSTLLRIMSGLEKEYSGEILLKNGISKMDFSFVFQQFALLPWLNVFENVELGLLRKPITSEERRKVVFEQLQRLGLTKFADYYPKVLSGGQRQRVGIARALATKPKVLFMDEPFSELDSFIASGLRKELLEIWKESSLTIIMVTHMINEAIELSDRVAVLTPLPGSIKEIVVNTLSRPRDNRSKDFFEMEDKLYALVSSNQ